MYSVHLHVGGGGIAVAVLVTALAPLVHGTGAPLAHGTEPAGLTRALAGPRRAFAAVLACTATRTFRPKRARRTCF